MDNSTFSLPFTIGLLIVGGFILYTLFKSVSNWAYNKSQPEESVDATVATKRMKVSGGGNDSMASTSYYIAFEFTNGDRKEFKVDGEEYGLLREDDQGVLTFQGNAFVSFERK